MWRLVSDRKELTLLLVENALKYVANRLPVIPLCWPDLSGNCACGRDHQDRAIGKVPLTINGLNDAALSASKVREYWGRWPSANIGIVVPSGLFVLDCDVDHNGFESLAQMQQDLDFDLTPTWLVTTGSGGYHYYYKTDKPIYNTTKLGDYAGLDIRGLGGYVVAPPSLHRAGFTYETSPVWDGEITMAPRQLIELCLKPAPSPSKERGVASLYQEGQRNDRLTRDAGAMRRRGLSEQAIYAALQVVNQEQCQPPLPDSEVRLITRSISRYEPQHPKKRMGVDL